MIYFNLTPFTTSIYGPKRAIPVGLGFIRVNYNFMNFNWDRYDKQGRSVHNNYEIERLFLFLAVFH